MERRGCWRFGFFLLATLALTAWLLLRTLTPSQPAPAEPGDTAPARVDSPHVPT